MALKVGGPYLRDSGIQGGVSWHSSVCDFIRVSE